DVGRTQIPFETRDLFRQLPELFVAKFPWWLVTYPLDFLDGPLPPCLQIGDPGLRFTNTITGPLLQTLPLIQNVQYRRNGGKNRSPENGGEEGANERGYERPPVGPRAAQGSQKILHSAG